MGLMHYLDAPSHVLHSFQKPFEQGCTVPQARRLARTSANKASVFDDKGRPLQPFFFHPTQQLENECPDNELFWTDKAVWSTHLRKCHSEYWKQHVQAVKACFRSISWAAQQMDFAAEVPLQERYSRVSSRFRCEFALFST